MKTKSILFSIFTIIVFVLLFNCDLNNNIPKQDSLIDSLYVVEQFTYNIGDTLNIVCLTSETENDTLTFEWQSIGGELIAHNDSAILTSNEDASVIVFCKVTNESGNKTTRSLTIDFANKVFIHGHVDKYCFETDSVMSNTPYRISFLDYERQGITDDQGDFVLEFSGYPGDLNVLIEQGEYRIDTLIEFQSLTQISNKRYAGLNISVPKYVDFFPISVGNTWTFNSLLFHNPYNSSTRLEGVETWEIIDVNTSSDTIRLNVSFNGQRTIYIDDGQSGYITTTQIDTTQIVVLVKREATYWFEYSDDGARNIISWCSIGSTYSPGMQLIKQGMPIIYPAKNIVRFNSIEKSWRFQHGVGPLYGRYAYPDWEWELELVSNNINSY